MKEGFPHDLMVKQRSKNPARIYAASGIFTAETVVDNDEFTVGGLRFRCVETPGHTPGHTCLYMVDEDIMFLGDHVLFDITPNIIVWTKLPNALDGYLKSLDKIAGFSMRLALPGHREVNKSVYERIEELKIHHDIRLRGCYEIIEEQPGLTAYDIAGLMKWKITARNWDDFPLGQKWFAFGEGLSHIRFLLSRDKIYGKTTDGIVRYYPTSSLAGGEQNG